MYRYLLRLVAATLSAQEWTNAIPSNRQALQNAIAGIGKRPIPLAPQRVQIAQQAPGACSVPLQTMQIDPGRSFAMKQVPSPEVEPTPREALPAPPCTGTATR